MLKLIVNEILESKGKTPYWLGKQTGISQNNVGKICNGETSTIRFDTLEKICDALDCSIEELFISDNKTQYQQMIQRIQLYVQKFNEINKSDTP